MERNLTSLESKLDAMLAAIENADAQPSVKQETKEDPKN